MYKANPNADLRYKEMNTYGCKWTAVEHRCSLDPSGGCSGMSWCNGWRTAAAGLEAAEESREEDEDEEARGKMKRTPIPIYKRMDTGHARELRRPKSSCGYMDASIFGMLIKARVS